MASRLEGTVRLHEILRFAASKRQPYSLEPSGEVLQLVPHVQSLIDAHTTMQKIASKHISILWLVQRLTRPPYSPTSRPPQRQEQKQPDPRFRTHQPQTVSTGPALADPCKGQLSLSVKDSGKLKKHICLCAKIGTQIGTLTNGYMD